MMTPHRHFHRIAWLAVLLAATVIVFGAFVRLSNAGLSCPDWPTCYGRATWPVDPAHIAEANKAFPDRPVELHKPWREQFHRHLAATLGVLVLTLAALAARQRRHGLPIVLGCAAVVALAVGAYIGKQYMASGLLVLAAEATLLSLAWRWRRDGIAGIALLTFAVIVFQAMLGMWTVTWLLKPIVVMGHLLGGMTTLSLLLWMAWKTTPDRALLAGNAAQLRRWGWLGLGLLAVQIALGGWVTSNYAALACGTDFPTCLGQWWPATDFHQGFVLWRGIGVDYEGGVLDGPARAAIQLTHRIGAVVVFAYLLGFAAWLRRSPGFGGWALALVLALVLQVSLGIANVLEALPLPLATAHNAGAVLLLVTLLSLLARLRAPTAPATP